MNSQIMYLVDLASEISELKHFKGANDLRSKKLLVLERTALAVRRGLWSVGYSDTQIKSEMAELGVFED